MKVLQSEKSRILHTNDYSKFAYSEYRIRTQTVTDLVADMTKKNLIKDMPIIVDDNLNVIDGRHRLLALKKIGAEVYYKVAEVAERLDFLIAKKYNKKATPFDFCAFHKDKLSYRLVLDFTKESNLSFDEVFSKILRLGTNHRSSEYKLFQEGFFEITPEQRKLFKMFLDYESLLEKYGLKITSADSIYHDYIVPLKIVEGILKKEEKILNIYKIESEGLLKDDFLNHLMKLFYKSSFSHDEIKDSFDLIYCLKQLGRYEDIDFIYSSVDWDELKRHAKEEPLVGRYGVREFTKWYYMAHDINNSFNEIQKEKELL